MQPIHWLLATVAVGALSALIVAMRSERPIVEQIRPWTTSMMDRLTPLTQSRALDRIHNAAARELADFVRRGSGQPGSIVVRLGAVAYQATAADDVRPAIGAARGAVVGLVPALLHAETLPIEIRRDLTLQPGKATAAVHPRRGGIGPTPPPPGPGEPPTKGPRQSTGAVLKALTPGVGDFKVRPGTPNSIGRLSCDIELPEWTGAALNTSRKHAMVTFDPRDLCLEVRDQNSTHGVRVNDVPVTNYVMRHGDKLTLGDAEWLLTIKQVNQ